MGYVMLMGQYGNDISRAAANNAQKSTTMDCAANNYIILANFTFLRSVWFAAAREMSCPYWLMKEPPTNI